MNCTGRISFAATFWFLTLLVFVQAYTTFTPGANSHHGTPIEIEYWDFKRKPIDQMVDITNELGIKVLAEHNYLNSNNIAFSPYGLMGILVALYEGVDGESSYQIQRSVPLPRDRRIVRIGFRDIHRALKTYFVPEEGFLAGLALNNENVTFTESYKNALRFYSFELQNELNATSSESTNMTSPMADTLVITTATTHIDTTTVQSTTRIKEESTTNHVTESLGATTAAAMESTTNVEIDTQTESPTTQSSSQTFTTETITTQTESPITTELLTTRDLTTTEIVSSPISTESTSPPTTTEIASSSTVTQTTPLLTTTESTSPQTTVGIESSSTTETMPPSTAFATIEDGGISTPTMPLITEQANNNTATSGNDSALETLQRRKKSLLDFLFTNPPDMNVYEEYRSFTIGQEGSEIDMDTQFEINGNRRIEVPYMYYDSVLHHAYLPHLEASAIRLPLDSDRYYLLIVLPLRSGYGEIERLLARMARESDLSDVYGALRPRRVRAKVPSFVVKGHVILTTDLQKLGIRDVFEPRQGDFTPMTSQTGVYVRSIEQAVSVSMRKYQPDELKKNISKRRRPITFTATYPFLYFVMDSTIHVSLMAGKLVDPLNSRIL
ncbi:uncharacterized protein LOC125060450 [Pieris napi]|uniref:uncharacterized protein LOC125060450 n=1 Tax=Pieris napi TaxID=78633 RepID=UPI001FBA64DB|nr:uncharacterized protein LOC125060450 [Pieris napi]